MSSAINSTDAISMKNYLIDSLSRLSTITPTLGRKFIDGHHADNHILLLIVPYGIETHFQETQRSFVLNF